MERKNNSAAGWTRVTYDCIEPPPMPGPVPPAVLPEPVPPVTLPEPVPPVTLPEPEPPITLPEPQPPVIPMPDLCEDMVLAMAYVKKQHWNEVYEAETGFERGTIFPELDLPFVGEGACPHDE